ncbi:hypothetical protein FGG08_000104 [Glutinoglossum americanum]|uniref:Protein CASP n=1 Tax=Glutinoglossum americanum TaxID=1670608 RepID=A0A9P8L743_9PEZI|nr:hypothetical protein FGG08_000104 [Glutinoglossum americanum]
MANTTPTTALDGVGAALEANGRVTGGTSPTGAHADEDTKFQKAISVWRNINLTNLLPSLDTTASDIVAHQRDSLVQRKDLAQKTKDFRKLDDAAKLVEWKGLLKAYQTFIDLLTNHTKSTSSAFLQLYSSLSDAPDPYPLLEASIESLLLSEDTLPKITSENQHLQKTIGKLTIQLEETENRLEGERKTRRLLEENQEAKVKEIETSWAAVLEEKKDNWEAKEKGLEEKIESQDRLFKEIKASYEVSQRLGRSDDGDGETRRNGVTAAELEIVHSDLERTSLRLAEVEARNEQLRLELAQTAAGPHPPDSAHAVEDDPTFLRIQSENSSLLRKLDAARVEKDSEKRNWESRIRGLEREINMLRDEGDSLRSKVQKWADYDEVKRELEMLKSIEFSTGDEDDLAGDEDVDPPGSLENGEVKKVKGDTLEQLLLARNKRLGNELTILRVSHQDLQNRLELLQAELANTNVELEKSRNLNTTLENDLEKFQQETSNPFPTAMSVAPTYASRYPQSGVHALGSYSGRRGKTSPTSSIISGFDPHSGSQASLDAIRAGEPAGGGSSILPMVAAQRDRFKQRNTQLENELARTHNTVSTLRQEIASLQKDNLQLYEKTRYVSSYNRGQPSTTSSTAFSTSPNPSTIQVSSSTASGLTLDRYRSAYEANISPFAAFRGRESARAFKRMSLPERVVFSITRMVLANRMSRNLFAAYCLALHLLVFGMLYWMGTVDIEKHASNLGGGALAAAAGAGAPEAHHGDWHKEGFND